jgi:hypothetical protein
MREAQLLQKFKPVLPPLPDRRGRIFADTIDGQNGSLAERRGVKRAGGVGLMVLSKQDPALVRQPGQFLPDGLAQIQLFAQPGGHCVQESLESARRDCQTGFQQTREFDDRLVIENNGIEVCHCQSSLRETVAHRVVRKSFVVFSSGKSFFLRRGCDFTIPQQSRRGVMIISGDAQDVAHGPEFT